MIAHLDAAQLAAAGADLEHQVETAKAAMRAALLAGGETGPLRTKLAKVAADIDLHATKIASLRAEAEVAAEQRVHATAAQIARASADRLRFMLAAVAAPRPPRAMRRRA